MLTDMRKQWYNIVGQHISTVCIHLNGNIPKYSIIAKQNIAVQCVEFTIFMVLSWVKEI